jgi:hypothetical protein
MKAQLFADAEHLGAANRAYALGRGFAVLHSDRLGVLHFPLGTAFDTITLHAFLLFLIQENKLFVRACQASRGYFLNYF